MTTYAREQDLLGWLMSQQSIPDNVAIVQHQWFSDRLHGQIYTVIRNLLEAGDLAIPPNVADLLEKIDPLNPGAADERREYVWSLVKNAGAMNLDYTVKALRERGKRHEMKMTLLAAINEMEGHESYELALSNALAKIDGIALEGIDRGLITGHDLNLVGAQWLRDRNERYGELPGLPTGIPDLDELILGLKPGELITIAGASGMGKTTIGTNIVEHVSSGWQSTNGIWCEGKNVLIVSREMGETQIALRHFSSQGAINNKSLQRGIMTESEWIALSSALDRIENMHVFYDLDSRTPSQALLRARQLKRKYGSIDLILVDSVNLMKSDHQRRARHEEVADITWSLKNMARELNIPIVQLSQITRNVSARSDKRPQLTDMSDSSSIEKDSDVVIGMYRDDYYDSDSPFIGMGEAIILKNRMGESNKSVPLIYQGMYNRFLPCDKQAWYDAQRAASNDKTDARPMRFKA